MKTATIGVKDGDLLATLREFFRSILRLEDISAIGVTEYYGLTLIDARQAFYVTGSDVLGPMGHELIPLASRAEAEEFMTDHKGRLVLQFDQVTQEMLMMLDEGQFE